ncbi:putative glycosyl hydrolase [Bacillus sp. TS-2]|nr:putative glycosyl hydrolase [Bacillus sp. TS-2]
MVEIHVVKRGDSIWQLANSYGVSVEMISDANQLQNPNALVVGQALIIPTSGRYHRIKQGDTLLTVSEYYRVTVESILRANQLRGNESIPIGYPLFIPTLARQKPVVDVSAYVDLNITGENSPQVLSEVAQYLTFVTIFSYELNADGTLTPINDQPTIEAAKNQNVAPLMVITNLKEGAFDTDIATTVLQSEDLQNKLLDEAISILDEKGYAGIDFDLEYLGAENREPYHQLLRKARVRLDEKNAYLSSALAPQTMAGMQGVLYEGHDYATQGEIVDFVFLMTYEWGWTGGPPMAVAPINQVRRVVEYASSVMPSNKIMLGIPLYGYDWTLPYVQGETRAKAIDHQDAIELAFKYQAEILFDEQAQSPYFNYWDEAGKQHEVWFEDARSIQAKFDLIKEFQLRGFFYWVLGWDFPQNWLLIEENFTVNKQT